MKNKTIDQLIQDVLELDNWELIYVFEKLSEKKNNSENKISIDKHTINIMRELLILIIETEVANIQQIEKTIDEAEDNAKMGQAGDLDFFIITSVLRFCQQMIKHLQQKKRDKKNLTRAHQIFQELIELNEENNENKLDS